MATISNGESGSSVRTKLNEIINKVEGVTSIDNNIDITGTITSDGLTVDGQAIIQTGLGTSLLTLKNTDSSISGGEAISFDMVYGDTANSTSWRALSRFAGTQYQLLSNIDNAGYVTRMALNENGDISFYEATGTTPKFFWDAAAESLGIGDTTPSQKLDVNGNIRVTSGFVEFSGDTSTPSAAAAIHRPADNTLAFSTLNTERMRISSDGSCRWTPDGTTQDMTLDASGNLLVGTTQVRLTEFGQTDAGINLLGQSGKEGQIQAQTSGTPVALFSRRASDGDIVQFRKDGSPVGSIGSSASGQYLHIGSGDIGITFAPNVDSIIPFNTSTGSYNANVDLGYSAGTKFRNIYLNSGVYVDSGGGVYLGGTGPANKLDDYEEGTWTPVYSGATTAGTGTYTRQAGTYVKIGDLVYASCTIGISAHTGSGGVEVNGLPFSALNSTANYAGISISYNDGHATTSGYQIIGFVQVNTAGIKLWETGGTGQQNPLALDTAFTELDFSIVYRAT